MSQSTYYSLEKALIVCEKNGLVREQVYILGRMGDTKKALALIVDGLGDIDQAIEFVQSQRDDDLWDEVINKSLKSPHLVGALLERIGA